MYQVIIKETKWNITNGYMFPKSSEIMYINIPIHVYDCNKLNSTGNRC